MTPQAMGYVCPPEVADALLSILSEALLLMRQAANADDPAFGADFCADEADHIHNLPHLIRRYSRNQLEHYMTWSRTSYINNYQKRFGKPSVIYLPYWERLEIYLRNTQS